MYWVYLHLSSNQSPKSVQISSRVLLFSSSRFRTVYRLKGVYIFRCFKSKTLLFKILNILLIGVKFTWVIIPTIHIFNIKLIIEIHLASIFEHNLYKAVHTRLLENPWCTHKVQPQLVLLLRLEVPCRICP